MVLDEADLLLDHGSQSTDVQAPAGSTAGGGGWGWGPYICPFLVVLNTFWPMKGECALVKVGKISGTHRETFRVQQDEAPFNALHQKMMEGEDFEVLGLGLNVNQVVLRMNYGLYILYIYIYIIYVRVHIRRGIL